MYLGQTQKDPYTYKGSGLYWNAHLRIHGNLVDTEILRECHTKEELRKWGLYYSDLWNVTESNNWANLKVEQGDGGRQSADVRKKISEAGKGRIPWNKGKNIWNAKERKRIGEQNKMRGPQSAETIAKRVSKTTGKKRTNEQRQRIRNSLKGRSLSPQHRAALKGKRPHVVPHNKGIKTGKPSGTAKIWQITNCETGISQSILSLRAWCEKYHLNYQNIHSNYANRNKPINGYIIQSKEK